MDKPTVKQIIKWIELEITSMEKYKAPTMEYEAELRTFYYVLNFLNAVSDKRYRFQYSDTGTEG
jgi:hypothetical protein